MSQGTGLIKTDLVSTTTLQAFPTFLRFQNTDVLKSITLQAKMSLTRALLVLENMAP